MKRERRRVTRQEILKYAKQILFNTDMVLAILDGRKTVARRAVKVSPYYPYFYKMHDNSDGALSGTKDRLFAGFYNERQIFYIDGQKHIDAVYYKAPYKPGDILYVRETWCEYGDLNDAEQIIDGTEKYYYRADGENPTPYNYFLIHRNGYDERRDFPVWHPSIHMPKEAARIFLKVTNVQVERLQDITTEQARSEGCDGRCECPSSGAEGSLSCVTRDFSIEKFGTVWDSAIKKSDIDR